MTPQCVIAGGLPRLMTPVLTLAIVLLPCAAASADYELERRKALLLSDGGKHEASMAAFLRLSQSADNDLKRADAFEHAAMQAHHLRQPQRALQLASMIPLAPQAKTTRMRLLAAEKQWAQILDEFQSEDPATWPRSVAAEAFHLRGKARLQMRDPQGALADLKQASRRSERVEVFFDLGNLCLDMKLDVEAADAYLLTQRATPDSAGWVYYTAVTNRAGILIHNGKHAQALTELQRIPDSVTGYWMVRTMILRARALTGLDRRGDAISLYRQALTVDGLYSVHRDEINADLRQLQP